MKVLWFTNIPMPAMDNVLGSEYLGSGFWMKALLKKLSLQDNIKIGVVTAWPSGADKYFSEKNIDYFIVSQPANISYLTERATDLKKCVQIVKKWRPDLIHIHGTERFYGLLKAREHVNVPTVISVQGMLGSDLQHMFDYKSFLEIIKSHRLIDIVRGRGLFFEYLLEIQGARREREIINSNSLFLGRTIWDHAHLKEINYNVKYCHVGELMREEFQQKNWELNNCSRNSIIITNAGHPRRGAETLLQSIALLKNEFPDVKLFLAGNIYTRSGYGRRFWKLIEKLDISSNIEMLGYLDASAMASALNKAHVFCIASHVENSPNSLCEAQLTGMPCIASYVGGIPSLVDEGTTGLLFPPGDAAVLADRIGHIFKNDELAIKLGINAKAVAMERHNPDRVVNQLLMAYNQAIMNSL